MGSPEARPDPASVAHRLFGGIANDNDLLAELLSFGQNARWRRFLVSRVAVPLDGRLLDVATGTARVARELAQRTPASIVGIDQSRGMLNVGARAIGDAGLGSRIGLVRGDARSLPFADETFGVGYRDVVVVVAATGGQADDRQEEHGEKKPTPHRRSRRRGVQQAVTGW